VGLYLIVLTAVVGFCFLGTAGTHKLPEPRNFVLEGGIRFCMYSILFVGTPLCSWIRILFGEEHDEAVYYWKGHLLFIFIGGILLISAVPERFFPGKFDLFGHSHMLMHVSTGAATYCHFRGLQLDIQLNAHSFSSSDVEHYVWLSSHLLGACILFMIACILVLNWSMLVRLYRFGGKHSD
jgi:hypothetical protein